MDEYARLPVKALFSNINGVGVKLTNGFYEPFVNFTPTPNTDKMGANLSLVHQHAKINSYSRG